MRQEINALGIKGSVLVIKNGKILLNYATDNTTDTSYLINSVQKSMTAAMVMREIQNGKLSMNDRLAKFYPSVPGADKVKIKNLLSMTSGLDIMPGEELGSEHFLSDEDNINQDIQKTVFSKDLLNQWYYSSLNYVYLCGIISQIEHKSYEELFRQTFIRPLKLRQAEFLWSEPEDIVASGLVPGFIYRNGRYDVVKHKTAVLDAHNELGAGSIVMSNYDLAKILRYILTGKLLTKSSREELYQTRSPLSNYGGGLYNYQGYKTANGAGEGYYTFLRTSDDAKDMIIIQSNRTKDGEFTYLRAQVDRIMAQLLKMN
ncbi:serine hydrolase [Lactobacillus sp. ESL0791]|uniref:serine hydrolase domain-containing protein n=1 Tax=Lactobacillus sp. ESL0791 TaxID=2983234 RepID=UPI0023F838E3|nr:serine hydrolase domain-containing protein [Lactobacillus sp. ESL0791]MDF7639802.1 serine hydrolase [Lactobacillus sp. ESL0791]